MTLHFSHIALACKDPLATERFYNKHFGFRRARVIPLGQEQIVFLKRASVYLELFQARGEAPLPPVGGAGPEYPGFRHLAFQVEDVDAHLATMGSEARILLGPISFDDFIRGWRSAWIADPDGNSVEISQGFIDQEQPPVA